MSNESGFGNKASKHILVPNFLSMNEFMQFRLYNSISAAYMNQIWANAMEVVNQKSAMAHNYSKSTFVLALPIHDQLALWEL